MGNSRKRSEQGKLGGNNTSSEIFDEDVVGCANGE